MEPLTPLGPTTVLIVDDHSPRRSALASVMREWGCFPVVADTRPASLRCGMTTPPDAVIYTTDEMVRLVVPVVRRIRGLSDAPIIVVGAGDDETLLVRVLDAGADDYVGKPFPMIHLKARVRARLRRREHLTNRFEVGDLCIDVLARRVHVAGRHVKLTPRQFDILVCLARHRGRVVSKQAIHAEVWHASQKGNERTIDVHVSSLRRKLGESAARPRYVHTVHGLGIRLAESGNTADRPQSENTADEP